MKLGETIQDHIITKAESDAKTQDDFALSRWISPLFYFAPDRYSKTMKEVRRALGYVASGIIYVETGSGGNRVTNTATSPGEPMGPLRVLIQHRSDTGPTGAVATQNLRHTRITTIGEFPPTDTEISE